MNSAAPPDRTSRLDRLLRDPLGIFKRKYSDHQKAKLAKMGKIKLQRLGHTSLLDRIDAEAKQPEWEDLWALYELIVDHRPNLVLEYGSGCSTIILAQALADAGAGQLISIETSKRWAKHTERNLPKNLKPHVEIRVLKPTRRIVGWPMSVGSFKPDRPWYLRKKKERSVGVATIVFPELHSLRPDFIYLDGPSTRYVQDNACSLRNSDLVPIVSDILFMEKDLPRPFTLVVEGRRHNCAFLFDNLKTLTPLSVRHIHSTTILQAE